MIRPTQQHGIARLQRLLQVAHLDKHSASAMDAAIQALGQYPELVSLSVKPVKE